jgi:hypothetical protein
MLIHREANISEIARGDLVAIELPGMYISGTVTDTDPAQGTLTFVPLACAEQSEGGTGFGIFGLKQSRGENAIILDTGGIKISKAVDSEAAVTDPLTWERIIELEPRVAVFLTEIQAECPTDWNWPQVWYGYKERLSDLVGWDREKASHPELRSSAAYNIVYHKLLDCLIDRIPPDKTTDPANTEG